jgi:Fic family protein
MIYRLPELDDAVRRQLADLTSVRHELAQQLRDASGWTGSLRRVAWAEAIRSSTAIEGFNTMPEEALAIVERGEPRHTDAATVAAIDGYRRAMDKVLVLAASPDFDWRRSDLLVLHADVAQGVARARPGRFRDHAVHLADGQGLIVFEPPPAAEVAGLTGEMCAWLRSDEASATPLVVRAAMAHLHVAVIHPWVDGNGRMARIVHSLVLAREGELAAPFASIEGLLGRHTQAYYAALAGVSPSGKYDPVTGDARPWLRFAVRAHLLQALEHQRTLAEAGGRFRLCTRLATEAGLPERAASALDQALLGLPSRNDAYRAEHGVSRPTATRDLVTLERRGLLQSRGQGRAVEYVTSDALVEAWAEARGTPALSDIDRRIQELAVGLAPSRDGDDRARVAERRPAAVASAAGRAAPVPGSPPPLSLGPQRHPHGVRAPKVMDNAERERRNHRCFPTRSTSSPSPPTLPASP